MLAELEQALIELPSMLNDPAQWNSVVINRRKPQTYRMFREWNGYRLCLHRFEACSKEESLPHPHPWPGAFAIIRGSYLMEVGYSHDRESVPASVMSVVMSAGGRYAMAEPLAWHSVVPREECYTVMINGPDWPTEVAHRSVRRTAGKRLQPMADKDLMAMLDVFQESIGSA